MFEPLKSTPVEMDKEISDDQLKKLLQTSSLYTGNLLNALTGYVKAQEASYDKSSGKSSKDIQSDKAMATQALMDWLKILDIVGKIKMTLPMAKRLISLLQPPATTSVTPPPEIKDALIPVSNEFKESLETTLLRSIDARMFKAIDVEKAKSDARIIIKTWFDTNPKLSPNVTAEQKAQQFLKALKNKYPLPSY